MTSFRWSGFGQTCFSLKTTRGKMDTLLFLFRSGSTHGFNNMGCITNEGIDTSRIVNGSIHFAKYTVVIENKS